MDIDGEEGKTHPELGAQIIHWLFDKKARSDYWFVPPPVWYEFCLYHSRYYAKNEDHPVSALALADKLGFVITPWWVFVPLAWMCGSLKEYHGLHKHKAWSSDSFKEWTKGAQAESWDWIYRTFDQPNPRKGYYDSWKKPQEQ